jgi:hypothetical protein
MKFFAIFLLIGIAAGSFTRSDAQVLFTASMDGSQESPPVVSSGTGTVWAVLSADMKTLTYRLTYAQLNAARTGAHFHAAGSGNGAIVLPLTFEGNSVSGVWTSLPDSIVRHLLRGEIYVNIHSTSSPAGEIRGYLRAAKGVGFTIALDGSQENPPNGSTGSGTGWAVLDSTGTQLAYGITVAGMTTPLTAGHFHTLPSGSIAQEIAFTDSSADGVWTGVPDNILTSIENGDLYVNVHSSTFPAGELRGYVTPVESATFIASMDGSQESPPVMSSGTGTVWAVLSADMKTLTYRLTYAQLNAARTGAHFHAAGSGNGAIVLPLTFEGNSVSGVWTSLPDSIVRHLLRGEIYVNIHSTSSPAGEIRGYLRAAKGVGFTIALDGSQENPPNGSTGSGTGWAVLDSTGTQLAYGITVAGMTTPLTAGHFHTLPSGSIAQEIAFTDSSADGVWTGVPDNILTSIENGDLYVNVHSSTFPAGELRGYVLFSRGSVTGVALPTHTLPASFSLEQNYPNPFNPSTTIRFQIAKTAEVTLKVFNLLGQEVASLFAGTRTPGSYEITFDAHALASGIYFYRLSSSGGGADTRKMILLK